jgi:hypothetical protein
VCGRSVFEFLNQAVIPGIEIGSIAVVDVQNGTALSLEDVGTPKITKNETGESMVDPYVSVILDKLPEIQALHNESPRSKLRGILVV